MSATAINSGNSKLRSRNPIEITPSLLRCLRFSTVVSQLLRLGDSFRRSCILFLLCVKLPQLSLLFVAVSMANSHRHTLSIAMSLQSPGDVWSLNWSILREEEETCGILFFWKDDDDLPRESNSQSLVMGSAAR